MNMAITVPENIIVHLGSPDASAENVTVPFADYIKNVASNEIYPTWPEEAIRANVLAEISYALNRLHTEWYPSQGYDFDITNDTRYDQSYRKNGEIYDNISRIVDESFNNYVVKGNSAVPYFTAYCDGRRTRCSGLEQWGSLELANNGLSAQEILESYYGGDVGLIYNAPVENIPRSYPGVPLKRGSAGEDVYSLQRELNRIARNYPAIGTLSEDGIFGENTENAVKEFQKIFNLTPDGIVGKDTWYKARKVYNAVMNLAELNSKIITADEYETGFPKDFSLGDSGMYVRFIQNYLSLIGAFDPEIPYIDADGYFGEATDKAVKAFQQKKGLPVTGRVDKPTWNEMQREYATIIEEMPEGLSDLGYDVFPGRLLTSGARGEDVYSLQRLINVIGRYDDNIGVIEETGVYDEPTALAVRKLQARAGLPVNGVTGPLLWEYLLKQAGYL